MKKNRDIVKEFSRKTGIVDSAVDLILAGLEETKLEGVEDFSRRTGITDPRIDYFIDRQDDEGYLHSGVTYGIDWGMIPEPPRHSWWVSDTLNYNSWVHGNWRPHSAQAERIRMWDSNKPTNKRGYAVMTGIRPWDDAPLSDAEKQAREGTLVAKVDEAVSTATDGIIEHFRRGGFGICEPSRNPYRNYIDGEWLIADKELPPPAPLKLKSHPTDPETS